MEPRGGGKRRIVVTDDGSGMDHDDALLAFDRHATSKIGSFEDLEKVATLGFRGEAALSSIAAVAGRNGHRAGGGEGVRVRIEGGRVRGVDPVPHPPGTRLEVASLFFNVPARRKFVKTAATELRRAVEVLHGYALARPDVRFVLRHGDRTLLDTLPTEDGVEGVRRRVEQIWGRGLASELVPLPERPLSRHGRVWGLVGRPSTTTGRRLFVFVNRRLVRDRAVLASFYRAVREQWQSEDFPALFLFLELPPEEVDVNVHPQKAEVRFREPRSVDDTAAALRVGLAAARGDEAAPLRAEDGADGPPRLSWHGLGAEGREAGWVAEPGRIAEAVYAPPQPLPVPLSGRGGGIHSLRLLGQYKGTMLLLEGPDALYLIDQHVAHERILFERLRRRLEAEEVPRQNLLTPLILELSAPEAMRLGELAPRLEACGWGLAELSGREMAVTAAPAGVPAEEAERILLHLAADLDPSESPEGVRRALLEAVAAERACKAAIKMHDPLSPEEMRRLVGQLFECESPTPAPTDAPSSSR
ncbi:MAG: DNA mismatch repair endonuclease MutL [Thermoanaerobaculia bacterium]